MTIFEVDIRRLVDNGHGEGPSPSHSVSIFVVDSTEISPIFCGCFVLTNEQARAMVTLAKSIPGFCMSKNDLDHMNFEIGLKE